MTPEQIAEKLSPVQREVLRVLDDWRNGNGWAELPGRGKGSTMARLFDLGLIHAEAVEAPWLAPRYALTEAGAAVVRAMAAAPQTMSEAEDLRREALVLPVCDKTGAAYAWASCLCWRGQPVLLTDLIKSTPEEAAAYARQLWGPIVKIRVCS